jgi:F1F0 ATPase subunit 2
MTLTTMMILTAAFIAGLVLGAFYFIALWQTVKRLSSTSHPVRLMLGSLVLRMAALTAVLYFVMGGHWERLAVAMLGFVVMRKILTVRLGPPKAVEAVH